MISRIIVSVALACACAAGAVVRLDVRERSDAPNGYERLAGKAYFAIDPQQRQNRIISDVEFAPRNTAGKVEFSADFEMLRPRDPKAGNGTAIIDVVNRGGRLLSGSFEFTGDHWLSAQGFTTIAIGWQWDVPQKPGMLRLDPVIATKNGRPITGLVRAEFTPDRAVNTFSLADRDMIPYAASEQDDAALVLTERDRLEGPRRTVPRDSWQLTADRQGVISTTSLVPGHIYELVYRAQDPVVAGLGLAAIRDIAAYLKHDAPDHRVERVIGYGVSQTGRLLRSFVYWGFNEDERGRIALDGVYAHVAGGGRGAFNQRFAQPSRDAQPITNTLYPVDIFPFTDLDETDPETGSRDGLLRSAEKARVVPKVFYTNSTYEYYGRAASLIHTTIDGTADAPLAAATRLYVFSGAQHGPAQFPPSAGAARFPQNPNQVRFGMRALLVAMHQWLSKGMEPPPSQYPTIAAGTLVRPEAVRFPQIPGVPFPKLIHKAYRCDYGPEFASKGIASIEPPKAGRAFPMLVPQVDEDGNELGGIRLPEHAVPLATYTGWNFRQPAQGSPDEMASFAGSWLLFPREKTGARYASREAYLDQVRKAAEALASKRFVLEGDLPRILEHSAAEWDYAASR